MSLSGIPSGKFQYITDLFWKESFQDLSDRLLRNNCAHHRKKRCVCGGGWKSHFPLDLVTMKWLLYKEEKLNLRSSIVPSGSEKGKINRGRNGCYQLKLMPLHLFSNMKKIPWGKKGVTRIIILSWNEIHRFCIINKLINKQTTVSATWLQFKRNRHWLKIHTTLYFIAQMLNFGPLRILSIRFLGI